jgi:carboxymethylenebutenolidase
MSQTLGHRATFLAGVALTLSLTFPGTAPAQLLGDAKKTVGTFESGGQKVTLWTYEPKKAGTYPAVVLLHGIEGLEGLEKHKANYDFVAKGVASKGYAVFVVHYFDRTRRNGEDLKALEANIKTMLVGGNGNAARDEEIRQLFIQWMGTAADAVRHARKQPGVDGDRVALVGFSLGGYVAMSTAVAEPDLRLGAVVEFFGGLPRELHAKVGRMPPTLIFHGDKDMIVPVKEARDLELTLKAKKNVVAVHIYENVGHMFMGDNMQIRLPLVLEAQATALKFLEKELKAKK